MGRAARGRAKGMFAAGPPVEAAHGFAALDGALPPHDQARGRGGGGGGSASHHAGRAAPGERRHRWAPVPVPARKIFAGRSGKGLPTFFVGKKVGRNGKGSKRPPARTSSKERPNSGTNRRSNPGSSRSCGSPLCPRARANRQQRLLHQKTTCPTGAIRVPR